MCERKPGPRCSADTGKTLRSLNEQLAAAKAVALEAEEAYNASPYDDDGVRGDKWMAAKVVCRDLSFKVEKASIEYDATPEGLESLRLLVDTAGDAVFNKSVGVDSYWDNFDEVQKTKWENLPLPKKSLLKKRLVRASAHREWQKSTLKMLEGFEQESPMKALFAAETLQASLGREEEGLKSSNLFGSNGDDVIFLAYGQNKSAANKKEAINLVLQQTDAALSGRYKAIEREDLSSYISVMRKKSEEELEAKLAFK